MADLAGFRAHAVLGSDESDAELQLCLDATKAYVKGAGVPEPETPNPLYDLLVYRLAAFYVDNRSFPDKAKDAEFFGCNSMIVQLREG